jgi:hypothetical protein
MQADLHARGTTYFPGHKPDRLLLLLLLLLRASPKN